MKKFLLTVWLLIPVAAAAYHFGPGQDQVTLDKAARLLHQADAMASEGNWEEAVTLYDEALAVLPEDRVETARRARLEKAKAKMHLGLLPDAYLELEALNQEIADGGDTDSPLADDAQEAMASAEHYVTWVLRLEGEPREAWEPIAESSRQTFRRLAEQAREQGDAEQAEKQEENLEAVIRLARMDLDELQGLPLPSQCNCKGSCKGCCKGKGKGKGQKRGTGKKPKDFRGAGKGAVIDQGGS